MNKKICFTKFAFILCTLAILFFCPVSALRTQAADVPVQMSSSSGETIEPRAPIIGWIHKEENGKIYRRLYNYSTGEWIGDWILCE